jgi:protein-S-isoprenylcysteine O-methyltransferase Ste14
MIAFIFYLVIFSFFTLGIELVFFPVKSQGSTYRILKDQKISLLKGACVLFPNLFVIGVVLYPVANLYFKWHLLTSSHWMAWMGVLLIGLGRWMSLGAMLQLRKKRGVLHRDGFFKWTRNPNIDGTMIFLLGMWLLMPNVFFLISSILVFLYLKSRAKIEEKYLMEFFGDQYLEYKNQTPSSLFI